MKRLSLLIAFPLLLCGATSSIPEASILRVLLAERPAHTDTETPEERKARLRLAAKAISAAAKNRHEAAALIAIGLHESRFAEFVSRGCSLIPATAGASCDNGRARSYWQMWFRACPSGWAFERGDPAAVDAFALCAVKHWRFASRICAKRPNHGPIAAGFAGFRTTTRCDWEPSKKRAETYWRIWRAL